MADMNTTQIPDLVLETTLPVGFIETSTFGDELAAIAETIAARSGYCSDRDELFERIQSVTESIPEWQAPAVLRDVIGRLIAVHLELLAERETSMP